MKISILIILICFITSCSRNAHRGSCTACPWDYKENIDTSSAEQSYTRGLLFLKQKKNFEAIVCFDKAIELKPDYAEAYNERGNAQSSDSKALDDYSKAIALNPNFAKAYFNRGIKKNMLQSMRRPTAGCPDICKAYELGYTKGRDFLSNCDCNIKTQ
jgi:tetratricopeptide (TPR) repeat protein